MAISITAAPDAGLVTLSDVKSYLNLDGTDEDALINSLIGAASNHLCGPDGILHRSVREWQYELVCYGFPVHAGNVDGAIRLPLPPIVSVDSITYTDADEAEQTLADTAYELIVDDADVPYVCPVSDTWPEAPFDSTVTIAYTAQSDPVPQEIKVACLMLIANMFDARDIVIKGQVMDNPTFARLLASHSYAVE